MQVLKYKVNRMLGLVDTIPVFENLKLVTYDGHDVQTVNLLIWLNATNIDYP